MTYAIGGFCYLAMKSTPKLAYKKELIVFERGREARRVPHEATLVNRFLSQLLDTRPGNTPKVKIDQVSDRFSFGNVMKPPQKLKTYIYSVTCGTPRPSADLEVCFFKAHRLLYHST